MKDSFRTDGFTLTEVVMALILLVTVFEALSGGILAGSRGVRTGRSMMAAVDIARLKLAEAGRNAPMVDGTKVAGSEGEFSWVLEVNRRAVPSTDDRAMPTLYDVAVLVEWQGPLLGSRRQIRLQSSRLDEAP